ncbi:hypothetical protein CGH22_24035 [Vibrio parahaemolyticus]|nr:hypothetical protein CGJ00_23930 [Vibrio parahaemolyticus]TOG99991.1 hypothetical protein CGI90_25850 [Vibrio parahaemolyticus]TOI87285.1 hypothetical protein CGI50_23265 [Vibrio parahaemolyticus]TON64347.1 hypothetical protein CGH53_23995 [Vibrio parahaemolyticus]TOO24478.1 hypothetical protein CGH40_22670 [Vibrio parahaemolyticus]
MSNAIQKPLHSTVNTQNHCKPKLPRVANLLELFVMRIFGSAKLACENITLNIKNYKRADDFL